MAMAEDSRRRHQSGEAVKRLERWLEQ